MALFHECSPKCAQNELDIADIVREARLRQVAQALCLGLHAESYCPGAVSVMGKRAATALLTPWFRASGSVRICFDGADVK